MQIIRFLTFADANRVLSAYSTFSLNSTVYYWQQGWENNDSLVGDTKENIVEFKEGNLKTHTFEFGAATLLSCWTILEGEKLSPSDWDLFPDRADGIAIISSVEAVSSLLSELREDVLDKDWHFAHDKVIYYDQNERPPLFETMDTWKWKRKRYEIQREYRFAFLKGSSGEKLQSVIFYVHDPSSYIQKIYFGPKMTKDKQHEILAGAIAAGVPGRIQNSWWSQTTSPGGKRLRQADERDHSGE